MRSWILLVAVLACSKNAKVEARADLDADVSAETGYEGDDTPNETAQGGWDSPAPSPEPKVLASGSPTSGALATLPGFRMMRDGSSRVYVEVIGRVPVTQTKTEGRVVIHMPGVRVPERVNKMDLPTTHFGNTPVGRVRLVQTHDNADLIIELRAPTRSRTRVDQRDNATVVRVDFPRFGGGAD